MVKEGFRTGIFGLVFSRNSVYYDKINGNKRIRTMDILYTKKDFLDIFSTMGIDEGMVVLGPNPHG